MEMEMEMEMEMDGISDCGPFHVLDANTIEVNGRLFSAQALGHDPTQEPYYEFGTTAWWIAASLSLAIVLCAGLMAGLTMGLVSLDGTYIDILSRTGTAEQRAISKKLKWFVKRHHLVLVTLLLANSLCNEALPLFLNKIVSEGIAIVLSVTLVLLFGEILPSALFTGPKQLKIGECLALHPYSFLPSFSLLRPLPPLLPRGPLHSLCLGMCSVVPHWFVLHPGVAHFQAAGQISTFSTFLALLLVSQLSPPLGFLNSRGLRPSSCCRCCFCCFVLHRLLEMTRA